MSPPPRALNVFISYAHEDEALRDKLEKQLAILRRQGLIETWHDRKITAGREWAGRIDAALRAADIVLLLISADFLASDYIYDVELTLAMERHEAGEARVLPIILRPCLWQRGVFAKLQALPKDGEPAISQTWGSLDEAFLSIAKGIAKAAEEIAAERTVRTAAGTPTQTVWNVPFWRNPNFAGRSALLAQLGATLSAGRPAALSGLGGIGKTQLALEYAWRHRDDHPVVWWIRAEDPATLAADYAALAAPLGLPEAQAREQHVVVAAVRAWLERNTGWLLVLDNAETRDAVRPYVPQGGGGAVIITSRSPVWGGLAERLDVKVLDPDEATDFLMRRTGDGDRQAAASLAEALGYLPLALEQAAAYIEEASDSLANYRKLFEEHHAALLKAGQPATEYPDTVATTWALAMERLDTPARALLNLCAFLAPEEIPLEVIVSQAAKLPEPLDQVAANPVTLNATLTGLLRYSLIGRKGDDLSVHRLVQMVVRDRLDEAGWANWAEAALAMVTAAFPYDSDYPETWPTCARLVSHALQAAHWVEIRGLAMGQIGTLLNQVGLYQSGRAEFDAARAQLERALRICEKTDGSDRPIMASRLNNLGGVLRGLGDLAGARALYERALRIDEKALGSDNPEVATDINNLGLVLRDLGDLAGAKESFERAIKIGEKTDGPNHPNAAIRVSNLGIVLHDLGDLVGAKENYERALRIDEKTYGPDHSNVAIRLSNLGLVLRDLGDLVSAKVHIDRAISISEKVYGHEHPNLATRVNNLSIVLLGLGDLVGAERQLKRALRIFRSAYGDQHPRTQTTQENLELVLRKMRDHPDP